MQFCELKCTLVGGLFLDPNAISILAHRLQVRPYACDGEGSELLNPNHDDALGLVLLKSSFDVKRNFSRAENYLVCLAFAVHRLQSWLELCAVGELTERRVGFGVFESYLRSGNDQGFAEVSKHLPPQDVEIVGGHCALGNLEVYIEGV